VVDEYLKLGRRRFLKEQLSLSVLRDSEGWRLGHLSV
jgi:hypothetical protein